MALLRLWRGPGTADRIVAADTLSVVATGAIVVVASLLDSALYLDVALLYGVLAFIGVIALLRFSTFDRPAARWLVTKQNWLSAISNLTATPPLLPALPMTPTRVSLPETF